MKNHSATLTQTIKSSLLPYLSGKTVVYNEREQIVSVDETPWSFTVIARKTKPGYRVAFGPPQEEIKRTLHEEEGTPKPQALKKLVSEMLANLSLSIEEVKLNKSREAKMLERREVESHLIDNYDNRPGFSYIYDTWNGILRLSILKDLSEQDLVEILEFIKRKTES